MIPKEEQPTPLQHRPITVMSSVYRLWASMRAKQLQGWQEKWIGDSLHGFRPEHGAENAFMETAILIERALLTEVPIHGVLFDIRKCFDSIPWGIAFGLLRDMGMDERIVRPLQSMYCNLRRHMKVMGTAGEDFQATNGILQGCALSVVVLNAVVSVWDRAVREEARVMTNAYADDTKVMSKDAGRVREGVRLTEEFGELTGLRYAKTHAFSTAAREARPIITMYEQKLEMKDTFRDLGAEVSAVKLEHPCRHQAHNRCKNTFALLDRIAYLPGATFNCRATLVMAMILPSALFGAATANPPHRTMRILTQKCVAAIRGAKVEFCGRRYRCSPLVTNLLCPGHRADPVIHMDYQRILAVTRAMQTPRLGDLVKEVYEIARGKFGPGKPPPEAQATAGPVTILLNTCAKRGWQWSQPGVIVAGQTRLELLHPEVGKMKHEVREALRQHMWKKAETNNLEGHLELHEGREMRRDVQGMGGGVQYMALERMVKDRSDPYRQIILHSVLTGSIVTQERLAREKKGVLPAKDEPLGLCLLCGEAVETVEHMWWECARTASCRAKAEYSQVMEMDRSAQLREPWVTAAGSLPAPQSRQRGDAQQDAEHAS